MANDTNSDVRVLLDVLRAVAQEGLSYSKSEDDTARYQKLMDIASEEYAALTGLPEEEVKATFLKEQGSITPKAGVDSAVINDKGEMLVLQQKDSGAWGMPGGWSNVDESPFETAIRQIKEEAELDVEPVGYIAIACKTPQTSPGSTLGWTSQVDICVAVKPVASDAEVTLSHEHTAYKWISDVVEIDNWNVAHKPLVERAFAAYRDQAIIPHMDNR